MGIIFVALSLVSAQYVFLKGSLSGKISRGKFM